MTLALGFLSRTFSSFIGGSNLNSTCVVAPKRALIILVLLTLTRNHYAHQLNASNFGTL